MPSAVKPLITQPLVLLLWKHAKFRSDLWKVDKPIDRPQQVIDRHMLLERKLNNAACSTRRCPIMIFSPVN